MNHRTPSALFTRILAALALCMGNGGAACAYDAPLTPAALHEAYILGQRNDQATAAFLAPYVNQATEGARSPHIAEVEILTPFAQVVDLSRRFTSGYSEEQAAREYHQRGDTIVVRIVLMRPSVFPKTQPAPNESSATPQPAAPQQAPPSNSALQPENFWQNFRFDIKQRGKTIKSRSVRNKPIYSTASKDTPAVLDGATIWLEYDAKDLAPEETQVEVTTPESKTIDATFDLKKLR